MHGARSWCCKWRLNFFNFSKYNSLPEKILFFNCFSIFFACSNLLLFQVPCSLNIFTFFFKEKFRYGQLFFFAEQWDLQFIGRRDAEYLQFFLRDGGIGVILDSIFVKEKFRYGQFYFCRIVGFALLVGCGIITIFNGPNTQQTILSFVLHKEQNNII